jgi:hypothetical protein
LIKAVAVDLEEPGDVEAGELAADTPRLVLSEGWR